MTEGETHTFSYHDRVRFRPDMLLGDPDMLGEVVGFSRDGDSAGHYVEVKWSNGQEGKYTAKLLLPTEE